MKKYLRNEFNLADYAGVADECPVWSAPFGLKLLDYIDYKPGITALDIGFGTGFPLTEIALRLGDTCTVYGIDPWKEATRRAVKKINYYGCSNIRIINGYAESIPLADESVNLIVSNNGINNVNDIDQVLSECSRIMKPGGQFIQTMNLSGTMFEFYCQLEKVLAEYNLINEIELMHRHINKKRPPLEEMISKIRKYGFMIKDLDHDQFNYRFATGTALLNHYFIRLAFMGSWVEILPEGKVREIFDSVEDRLNHQAKRFGCLKLSIPFVLINSFKRTGLEP